jgi:hypothetical protein
MIHITRILPNYKNHLGNCQVMNECPEPMPIRVKDDSIALLPSCPTCRAALDLKLLESFGSRHIVTTMEIILL